MYNLESCTNFLEKFAPQPQQSCDIFCLVASVILIFSSNYLTHIDELHGATTVFSQL